MFSFLLLIFFSLSITRVAQFPSCVYYTCLTQSLSLVVVEEDKHQFFFLLVVVVKSLRAWILYDRVSRIETSLTREARKNRNRMR